MAFTDLFEGLDLACIKVFGITATFNPQGGESVQVTGIFAPPAMMEELLPGQGVTNIRFFVRYVDITPAPKKGDTITIADPLGNPINYTVAECDVDSAGGAMLRLRRNA